MPRQPQMSDQDVNEARRRLIEQLNELCRSFQR